MVKPSAFSRSLIAVLLTAILSISAFADTIRLKDGSIIKGKITGFSGGSFTVVIGEGARRREMTFAASDIESIVFDSVPAIESSAAVPTKPTSTNTSSKPQVIVSDNTASKQPAAVKKPEPIVAKQTETAVSPPLRQASSARPVEVNVRVAGDNRNNGWTNSGWVVKKGQKIRITGTGQISIGGGRTTAPSGLYDFEDGSKLLKSVPTGALIAVIGDDNNDFIYIGSSREFVAERDGALFLGVNEGNLEDNSGAFDVKIEIMPNGE